MGERGRAAPLHSAAMWVHMTLVRTGFLGCGLLANMSPSPPPPTTWTLPLSDARAPARVTWLPPRCGTG